MRITQADVSDTQSLSSAISIEAVFQPVYSVREMKMIGVEAQCRGYSGISCDEVPAAQMIAQAESEGNVSELDEICRNTAFKAFKEIPGKRPDFLLFLSIHSSMVEPCQDESERLIERAFRYSIDPYSTVIEIDESEIKNIDSLIYFIQQYRKLGFLIALKKVGAKGSNLERISLIKPDIVSIDKELISSIDELYYKQEVAKALLSLSNRIGALTIAKGIERKQEALCCLETGFDMLQGFFLSGSLTAGRIRPSDREPILGLGEQLREKVSIDIKQQQQDMLLRKEKINRIINRLAKKKAPEFASVLRSALRSAEFIHCLYILDNKGVQVTPTVTVKRLHRKKHRLFGPASEGTDHSLKSYFLQRSGTSGLYFSRPYVSKATGFHCVTASVEFSNCSGESYYLCMDLTHHIRNSHNRVITTKTIA